jgi:hypothetical protein
VLKGGLGSQKIHTASVLRHDLWPKTTENNTSVHPWGEKAEADPLRMTSFSSNRSM